MSADRIGDLWAQASASVDREDWAGALRVFEELLAAQPDDPRVLYNKALVHLEMHDSQTAREHLRRAVEIDPDYALAQAELAQIEAPHAVPTPQPPAQPPVPHTPPTAPIGDVRDILAEDFPLAEMNLKAGLAIWVILGVLMALFWSVRQDNGPAVAFAALAIVFGIYAAIVFKEVGAQHRWIVPSSATDDERRIYERLKSAAEKAKLPMPKVAVIDDESINAMTYGFSPDSARVVVTKGLMDHVKPTDEELEAVLAHELSHVHHGDCVYSMLLGFPIWLMQKMRLLLEWVRWLLAQVNQVVGCLGACMTELGCGIVTLVVGLALLAAWVFISIEIAYIGACIWVCSLFLNAFQREREYLADLYAARLTGAVEPTQSVHSKMVLACARIEEERIRRFESAGEGDEVDMRVSAPQAAFDPSEVTRVTNEALNMRPSFWRSLTEREFLSDHPLTENRVYFVSRPRERKRYCSAVLRYFENLAARWLGHKGRADSMPPGIIPGGIGAPTVAVGVGVGLWFAVLPVLGHHWVIDALLMLGLAAGGFGLGFAAGRERWSGSLFARRSFAASFLAGTVLLAVGPVLGNEMTVAFPLVFLLSLVSCNTLGILGARAASG